MEFSSYSYKIGNVSVCKQMCVCICKTAKFEKYWLTVFSPVKSSTSCIMNLKELKILSVACHPNSLLKTSEVFSYARI